MSWIVQRGIYRPNAALDISVGITPATWSTVDASAQGYTLTNGNKTAIKSSAAAWKALRISQGKTSGKWYAEAECTVAGTTALYQMGLANNAFNAGQYLGEASSGPAIGIQPDGSTNNTAEFTVVNNPSMTAGAPTLGKVYGFHINMTDGRAWLSNDNSFAAGGNPATEANPWVTFTPGTIGTLFMAIAQLADGGGTWTLRCASGELNYSPAAGYTAWDG